MSNIPSDLKYTQDHEYVRLEGNIATVGITDHAQRQLGQLVFIETPQVGKKFEEGEPFGSLESVKAVAEVFSPATGTIQEVNSSVTDDPELANEDPYGEGWLVKIRVDDTNSLNNLMPASQYEEFIKAEASE